MELKQLFMKLNIPTGKIRFTGTPLILLSVMALINVFLMNLKE
jgi:hypothetical protein